MALVSAWDERKKRIALTSDAFEKYISAELDPASAQAINTALALSGDRLVMKEALESTNNMPAWNQALIEMGRIKDLCKKSNTRLIAVLFPIEFQLRFGYQNPEPQRTIKNYLTAQEIEFIDMRPFFKEETDHDRRCYLFDDDMLHFNAHGHEITADRLYRKLSGRS
jgi:hypothetical protein